jgi:lysine-ketoglutarate reductase/saccharopine dehydrogenase-like protein (TIGR00300 family)
VAQRDVTVAPAPQDGVFPEGFYSTTNLPTSIRWNGAWLHVERLEMDCGITVDAATGRAHCLPMHRVRRGDAFVVGFEGVRVSPADRPPAGELFEFMGSSVSSEKPKRRLVAEIAQWLLADRAAGRPALLVAGPAVVHTGGAGLVARLIREGLVGALFAGNGLATHDLEASIHGTSLGVPLAGGRPQGAGHQNHLRTINTIRRCGSIRSAVEQGVVTSGIMHACVTSGTPFILAGSIRDDGPLPEVITDSVAAMDAVRAIVPRVDTVVVVSSMLHAIAVGNVLPASVRLVVVDINPAALTKIMDRGSFQTVGIVSDADLFLHQLVGALAAIPGRQE